MAYLSVETQSLVTEIYFNQNLTPRKIYEDMIILNSKFGADTCRTTLNYIMVVLGKYMQMVVTYHIHKGNLDNVEKDFARFNSILDQLVKDFSKVTGEDFISGSGKEQSNLTTIWLQFNS